MHRASLGLLAGATRHFAQVDPSSVARNARRATRDDGWRVVPLSTQHPVFGLKPQSARFAPRRDRRNPLCTDHPAFGPRRAISNSSDFVSPVGVSGFFLAVDPSLAGGTQSHMNPNARLTLRDGVGNRSRVRYRCHLLCRGGFKLEALVRFQVGWISPVVLFSTIPSVIHLGRGVDVSVPFIFHFSMVSILDEHGDSTGSFLYFSGTPIAGLSVGFQKIVSGKLVLDPVHEVDPLVDREDFIGQVHYRQAIFVLLKCAVYALCFVACMTPTHRILQCVLPDPFHRHTEQPL